MATFIVEGTEGRRQQHAAALWRAPMAIDHSSRRDRAHVKRWHVCQLREQHAAAVILVLQ